MAASSLSTLYTPNLLPFTQFPNHRSPIAHLSSRIQKRRRIIRSATQQGREVVPVKDDKTKNRGEARFDEVEVEGFSPSKKETEVADDPDRLTSRAINAIMVLGFGTFAVTKLLTIDHDYWHGWTLYEILRYAPEHNWIAYEQALKSNPVLAKMAISGVVYSIGDWIAQCYEGKPLFEFDRTRLFRSGLVGFTLHGSLSHYYYQICEALFPFQEWWVVPAKVAFDQTVWASIWNSIYFVVLGLLRLESLTNIYGELKSTFWPMLTTGEISKAYLQQFCQAKNGARSTSTISYSQAQIWSVIVLGLDVLFGIFIWRINEWHIHQTVDHILALADHKAGWKLWPFAHLITYGVIPVEQRLLWVDCVELIWVTILSTYSNEKSEARMSEAVSETKSSTSNQNSKE